MTNNNFKWYTYLSYYAFFWFVLFKLGIINLNPTPIYLFIIAYLIFQLFNIVVTFLGKYLKIRKRKRNRKNEEEKNMKLNKNIFIFFLIIVIVLDIVPLFFIPFELDKYNIYATLMLCFVYLLFMKHIDINIWLHYFNLDKKLSSTKNITFKQLLNKVF